MSSTWPEQHQQGCLTAERDVFRAWHPQSPLVWQWPTICECPVHRLLYILGHLTWNLKSTLPTIQWHASSLSNMHSNEPNTVVPIHILPYWHSKLHPSTPSFHLQQSCCTNANSEQPFQLRYATATHQPYTSMSRSTHALNLLRHRLTNAAKHLHHCMLVNQLQHMTPSKRFGFLLLWYASSHRTAIKYAPAMVPHTAACGDTSMNAVSKQLTLSQVAQLPHCRLWQDTSSQQYNLHCPHLHHACSTHPLHLQHWQPRWTRLQAVPAMPAVPKNAPSTNACDIPGHTCADHKDPAMPAWHQDTWSRKSRNYWPRLPTDIVL